jgi:hypothetical protein
MCFVLTFKAAPAIAKPLEGTLDVQENTPCTLEFQSSGIPIPSVTWLVFCSFHQYLKLKRSFKAKIYQYSRMKDKATLAESERVKITAEATEPNLTTFKLITENCKSEDSGQYIAKVKNNLGEATTQAKVNVQFGPKFVNELPAELNVKEHETAKLATEIIANPKAEISWFKKDASGENGEPLKTGEKFKVDAQQVPGSLQTNSALSVKDSLLTDSGEYVCVAKNTISESASLSKVNVAIPPKFIQAPEPSKEVEIGQDLQFKCVLKAFPIAQVQFLQNQKVLESSEEGPFVIQSNQLNETDVEYTFTVKSVAADSATDFLCKAVNAGGDATAKFSLNIIRKPEFIKKPDECVNLVENKEILIDVQVQAWPDATLAWFKDGVKIAPSKRIQFVDEKPKVQGKKSYSMKFVSASKDDTGSYEIVATNKLGEDRCGFKVLCDYAPVIAKDLKAKEKAIEGTPFVLECTVKGFPKPEITW